MQATLRHLVTAAVTACAALSVASAFAQQAQDERESSGTEAIGQSTSPRMMNSTVRAEDVQREAIAAAHAGGNSEAVGQSTAAPALSSSMSADEAYKGAVAASHATSSESVGETTAHRLPGAGG
ncbi:MULTISPECIES: hypothetical protein [unclassified Variovorax]|uniref:hypothetical protein n=1 Tax=unclassified Variovorax TaxID=663243 RepID=UPI001BD28DD8|nr:MULTISPECIES: hypothetical protein [unclassified Variovorax]